MAIIEIKVPDLDGMVDVGIMEVYISSGDKVEIETPLISLESEKAVMDVPSPLAGTITEVRVSEGSTVNVGDVIALAEYKENSEEHPADEDSDTLVETNPSEEKAVQDTAPKTDNKTAHSEKNEGEATGDTPQSNTQHHATPSVRMLARELGVDLGLIQGSGPKGRITREDVSAWVKTALNSGVKTGASSAEGFDLPPIPEIDFSTFGSVKHEPLSRIKKISGPHLHRNWLGIPHVTQFDNADITELESFRKSLNDENAKKGLQKISPLIFIIKAAAAALKEFPDFNSSLNPDSISITKKSYINIGVAVDTPAGLVVPVIPHTETKGIREIADYLADLSSRARAGTLKADEMKGGTFTVSSLGGIGGTGFTPIINAPEAAILGVSKSSIQPVWQDGAFVPRLILPIAVSYDHRIIDGAQGARFISFLTSLLGDMRRVLL